MTTAQFLARLRRKMNDVDPATQSYTDEELLTATGDCVQELVVRRVSGFDSYAVDADAGTMTPDPIAEDAELLLHGVAAMLLTQTFRGRTNRGELGTVWKSGLEEESSVEASKSYRAMIRDLVTQYKELILIRVRSTFATRPQ